VFILSSVFQYKMLKIFNS